MIPRYTRPEMARLWEPAHRFAIWFRIEAHATEALEAKGVVPAGTAAALWAKGDRPYTQARIARIDAIEREVKHDVIAFLTHLAEIVGPEARFVHQGMTSSDVLDTCLSVQLARASDLLLTGIDLVLAALKRAGIDLVASLMDWEKIRHVPVEDNEHHRAAALHQGSIKLHASCRVRNFPQAWRVLCHKLGTVWR